MGARGPVGATGYGGGVPEEGGRGPGTAPGPDGGGADGARGPGMNGRRANGGRGRPPVWVENAEETQVRQAV